MIHFRLPINPVRARNFSCELGQTGSNYPVEDGDDQELPEYVRLTAIEESNND